MKKLASIASLLMLVGIVMMVAFGASAKVCSTAGGRKLRRIPRKRLLRQNRRRPRDTVGRDLRLWFITWTCGESTVEGEVTNGVTGIGKITKMTFGDCSSNLNTTTGRCTVTTSASSTNACPWPVSATTAPNATMSVENIT